MITSGLNHAAHSGVFGDDVAAALITGKDRHLFGPDARAWMATFGTGSAVTASIELGKLEILRGSEKGVHPICDASGGLGHSGLSVGGEFTKLYFSGNLSDIKASTFYGPRFEFNGSLSLGAGMGISANAIYSQTKGGFVIGWGAGLNVGVYNIGAEINWGASGKNFQDVKKFIKN